MRHSVAAFRSAGILGSVNARRMLMAAVVAYPLVAVGLDRYGRHQRPSGEYDAIVVAGCRVMPSGRPSRSLARRVDQAVELWKEGWAPRIVFTGGVGDAPRSEAAAAAERARSQGVPRRAIVLEERSTSTDENARFAAELIGSEARVLVVSDAYHVYRCERVFGRHFAAVQGAGSVGHWAPRVKGALREVFALSAYLVFDMA